VDETKHDPVGRRARQCRWDRWACPIRSRCRPVTGFDSCPLDSAPKNPNVPSNSLLLRETFPLLFDGVLLRDGCVDEREWQAGLQTSDAAAAADETLLAETDLHQRPSRARRGRNRELSVSSSATDPTMSVMRDRTNRLEVLLVGVHEQNS
jgi:hypothetical protein